MSWLKQHLTAATFACLSLTGAALAQNPFAAIVEVDNIKVTRFEVDQRLAFLTVLNAPGTSRENVIETLTDEVLQLRAAREAGIEPSEDEYNQGLLEFAERTNADPEQLIAFLGSNNIPEETVRTFVRNGISWRQFVQQRFGPLAQVSEDELDRALSLTTGKGAVRVLLSEIALPMAPEVAEANTDLLEQLSTSIKTKDQFRQSAFAYSAAPSAANGGELNWLSLSDLPPVVASELLVMAPGEITEPINLGNFAALFMLRGFQERAASAPRSLAVEYAVVPIPGANAQAVAQELRARSDTCDDLYGTTDGLPVGEITRDVRQPRALPRDLAVELAKLDAGEVSTLLPLLGGGLRFVMLCGRTPNFAEGEREELRRSLFGQRLESYADGYLDELRAAADIRRVAP